MLLKIILTLVLRVNQIEKTCNPRRRSRFVNRYFLLSLNLDFSGLIRDLKLLVFALESI